MDSKHENINLDIPGLSSEFITGNKARNTRKGRYSGGIAFYYRTDLKNILLLLKRSNQGLFG